MTTKQNFSSLPMPAADDRDPDSQIVRLSAAWRLKRGMDDSSDNIVQSVVAVLRDHPELGTAYKFRRDEIDRHGDAAFESIELVRS